MAQAGPEHMVLKYDYVKDILEKRDPYRADHLAAAQAVADRGNMVIAGALMEPVDGALFIFKGVTKEHIEAFVKNDPYMKAGLVTGYEIRPYMAVVKGTEI